MDKEKEIIRARKNRIPDHIRIRIKRMLGLSYEQPFAKCPGMQGRCKHTAGYGTKGDFYGLGFEVGHFGVGHCMYHEKYKSKERVWEFARKHMDAIRTFGTASMPANVFERLAIEEAREVEKYDDMKRGIDLVVKTLKDYEKKIQEDDFREYISAGQGLGQELAPASDVTKAEMALKIAKTLTATKLDDFRMAANDYIHVGEVVTRLPKEITHAKRMFAKLMELKAKFKDGDRNPIEQIEEEYLTGMKEIWKDMKSGEKK